MATLPVRTLTSTRQEHLDDHNNIIRPTINALDGQDIAGRLAALNNGRVEKVYDSGTNAYIWPSGGAPTGYKFIDFIDWTGGTKNPLSTTGGCASSTANNGYRWVKVGA
jgi:hypothetical protein